MTKEPKNVLDFNQSCLSGPNPEQIKRLAAQTRTPAFKYAAAILKEIGVADTAANRHIIMAALKEDKSIERKATSQYNGKRHLVDDGCRLMILLDTPKQMQRALQIFGVNARNHGFNAKMREHGKGYRHHKPPRDYMTYPKRWGWLGIQLKMATTVGKGQEGKFEVQIIMRGMKPAYDQTHALYENVRTALETWERSNQNIHEVLTPEQIQMVQNILDIHRNAAIDCGADVFYSEFPVLDDPPPMIEEPDIRPIELDTNPVPQASAEDSIQQDHSAGGPTTPEPSR